MDRLQLSEALDDINERRLRAFVDAGVTGKIPARERLQAMADATTLDDLSVISEARDLLDDFSQQVLRAATDTAEDYARGLRCGVCGYTGAQSRALGYDCIREC